MTIATDRVRRPTRRYGALKVWGAVAGQQQLWRPAPLPTYYITGRTPADRRSQIEAAVADAAARAGLEAPR
jgi:hypothetical protein